MRGSTSNEKGSVQDVVKLPIAELEAFKINFHAGKFKKKQKHDQTPANEPTQSQVLESMAGGTIHLEGRPGTPVSVEGLKIENDVVVVNTSNIEKVPISKTKTVSWDPDVMSPLPNLKAIAKKNGRPYKGRDMEPRSDLELINRKGQAEAMVTALADAAAISFEASTSVVAEPAHPDVMQVEATASPGATQMAVSSPSTPQKKTDKDIREHPENRTGKRSRSRSRLSFNCKSTCCLPNFCNKARN